MAEYIEREAALRQFTIDKNGNRIREVDVDNWLVEISIRQVKKMLREIPAADVAPVVHGRWVLKERAHYFKCSLCKEPIPYKFGYDNSRRYYNYCPNCGARMDLEVNDG